MSVIQADLCRAIFHADVSFPRIASPAFFFRIACDSQENNIGFQNEAGDHVGVRGHLLHSCECFTPVLEFIRYTSDQKDRIEHTRCCIRM